MTHIVLDEADTLLDDSFSELTLRILRKLKVFYSVESYAGHFNCLVEVWCLSVHASSPTQICCKWRRKRRGNLLVGYLIDGCESGVYCNTVQNYDVRASL